MAPSHSRHLLVWTTLPIAVLLSYLWFKRKRSGVQSDPGRAEPLSEPTPEKSIEQEIRETEEAEEQQQSISRSLSGVKTSSSPIDIILPPELKSAKSSLLVISDEDLDLEIEKIKSMKNSSTEYFAKKEISDATKSPASQKTAKGFGGAPKKERVTLKQASPRRHPKVQKEDELKLEKSPETNRRADMAQKDVVTISSVEKKIGSLKIDTKETCTLQKSSNPRSIVTESDVQRQSSERDSANHSPADVMLASPSLSSISDTHSEGSSDSGKGCSEVATPPSRTPAGDGSVSGDVNLPTVYEFIIPQNLVGKLIGRNGYSVQQIKNKTHVNIIIKKHPESSKVKVCVVEGTPSEIDHALEVIRDKFPEKRYPEFTLEQVYIEPSVAVPLLPEHLCLVKLVEGINNDTIVSCMVAPNHLFLQQPAHPTFPNLNILSSCMNMCYADANSPMLPNPMPENPVCAAYSIGAWYRALVLSTDAETDISYVKFLDYGGYANVKNSELRQIRADFLMLPFQASECYLANIRSKSGDSTEWSDKAFNLVADLTKGAMVYTQVAEYTEDGVPLVLMYVAVGPQRVVFLNGELVNQGHAEWILPETENLEGAVGGITE